MCVRFVSICHVSLLSQINIQVFQHHENERQRCSNHVLDWRCFGANKISHVGWLNIGEWIVVVCVCVWCYFLSGFFQNTVSCMNVSPINHYVDLAFDCVIVITADASD